MAWVVDGSNVLGAMGADQVAVDPKRELARLLAAFARGRRTRVTCYFDGPEPPSFARHLGAATIIFSGKRSADDLIVEQTSSMRDARVVTADRGLAARVGTRRVKVQSPADFLRELALAPTGETAGEGDEWEAWFANPQNRLKF